MQLYNELYQQFSPILKEMAEGRDLRELSRENQEIRRWTGIVGVCHTPDKAAADACYKKLSDHCKDGLKVNLIGLHLIREEKTQTYLKPGCKQTYLEFPLSGEAWMAVYMYCSDDILEVFDNSRTTCLAWF